jgi:predicted permease
MSLWPDILLGIRGLRRQPVSALITSFTLALGLGLCTTVWSLLYGVFFRTHPVPEPDRLLLVFRTNPTQQIEFGGVPVHDFYDWQSQQTSFEQLARFYTGTVNLAGTEGPERYEGGFVSANTFDVMRIKPVVGSSFRPGDSDPGAPLTIVLGYRTWETRYRSDPQVVGKTAMVNGEAATILGVMPKGIRFPEDQDIWVALRDDRSRVTERGRGSQSRVLGRLKPGISRDQAELEFATIAKRLETEYPKSNGGFSTRFRTFTDDNTGPELRAVFGGMQVATIFVLLIAIANVANLLMARATLRTREAAVRTAIGASRLRVVAPFFAETAVLALVGAIFGIAIAYVGVTLFDGATANVGKPYYMAFRIDLPVMAFLLGITLLTTLLAGLAPAFYVLKTDVNATLKDDARGSGVLGGRFTKALVAAEIALSCALLIGAGLMVRSIVKLRQFEYPFQTERIFTARVGLFDSEYPDSNARRTFFTSLEQRLRTIPGARDVALATDLPINAGTYPIGFPGKTYATSNDYPEARSASVTPAFFATFGVTAVAGRLFNDADRSNSQPVALVNQSFVKRFLEGKDPLGQRFAIRERRDSLGAWMTIVGVVPDLRMEGFDTDDKDPSGFYLPMAQDDPRFVSIAVASIGPDPMALTGAVRQAVATLNPNQPIYQVDSMKGVIRQASWYYYVFGTLFIVFGAAALSMATVGLYGVLAFSVSRRTRELGIRMALGANAADVIRLVLRQGGKQLAIGLVAGLLIAFGLTRVIGILMFEVTPQDPPVFTLVVLLIAVVGLLASFLPARKATGVQPVVALRTE